MRDLCPTADRKVVVSLVSIINTTRRRGDDYTQHPTHISQTKTQGGVTCEPNFKVSGRENQEAFF